MGGVEVFSFEAVDHRSQPKCNWTRRAASRLSLSLITNYNRGQLKPFSKQCWFYNPRQRNLLIHANTRWKAYWVSSFPRMLTETNNECSTIRYSERTECTTSPKLRNIHSHHIGTTECKLAQQNIPIMKPGQHAKKLF